MTIRFLDCSLDLDRQEIHRDGREVEVEPQVFAVLQYLVENRERVVPKTELLDNIWGDRFVSEAALSSRVSAARRAVGDDGRSQRAIKTVHGRGFRFVAETTEGRGSAHGDQAGIDDLEASLDALEAGVGFALALTGPPDSGKSRLLESATSSARARGIPAGCGTFAVGGRLHGRGLLDALDQIVHLTPGLSAAMPDPIWEELQRCFAGEPPTTNARLSLAVRELVLEATARGPVLIAVDDLDHASNASVQLLSILQTSAQRRPLGLLVAHEPGAHEHGLVEVVLEGSPTTNVSSPAVPKALAEPLTRLAVCVDAFDLLQVRAITGLDSEDVDRLLTRALASEILERVDDQFRFSSSAVAGELVSAVPASARERILFESAGRLADLGAPREQIAAQYLEAGAPAEASPFALAAAQEALARHAYLDARAWVEATCTAAPPDIAHQLRLVEADAFAGSGDPQAVAAYRSVIESSPVDEVPLLRAKLGRAALLSGDTASAVEALSGLEPDGGMADGSIYLVRGLLAYYQGDTVAAEEAAERAAEAALKPGASVRLMDAITLQGLISHANGEWFDRLHRELRTNPGHSDHLSTFFDAHLCVAEYMLYGPIPYDEVVGMAGSLRAEAEKVGAAPARAFAAAVAGEAALLAGNLDEARRDLDEAFRLHQEMGATTGTAHTLQRLAELELALGNRQEAQALARRSLAAGRWSPLAHHLVQRAYGTLIAASSDIESALAAAAEADLGLDATSQCPVCDVMVYVPMTMAYADAGDLESASAALVKAEASASFWRGGGWPAAIAEARAAIARADGRDEEAKELLEYAIAQFEGVGQVLDSERCRDTLAGLPTPS